MGQPAEKYVRSVGGDLVSSRIAHTPCLRVEILRRQSGGRMHWHFRQPELSLFWFAKGAERLRATIDGRPVNCSFPGKSRMAIFPAAIEIEGEWNVGPTLDYTVVFLNPSFVGERLPTAIANPTLAFEHDELKRGLSELCREAASPDNVFNLLAEGWATQALAHIVRVSGKNHEHHTELRGGLPRRSLRLLDEYVRENLARPISLAELSGIAGLSKRHFLRAFQDSVGATPYRYVISLRIDEAKRRLSETDDSITDVALATGFGQAQHFSTSFRKATGLTPSLFRHRSLG
jgi:AraC family transcriptional regulator